MKFAGKHLKVKQAPKEHLTGNCLFGREAFHPGTTVTVEEKHKKVEDILEKQETK